MLFGMIVMDEGVFEAARAAFADAASETNVRLG